MTRRQRREHTAAVKYEKNRWKRRRRELDDRINAMVANNKHMKVYDPPMIFKSQEMAALWASGVKKNQDAYGYACFRFASTWATLMEAEIRGLPDDKVTARILEIVERTGQEADNEGISGNMYGVGVAIVSDCWIYGEIVRAWHNGQYNTNGQGDKATAEGRTINPAVLHIRAPEGDERDIEQVILDAVEHAAKAGGMRIVTTDPDGRPRILPDDLPEPTHPGLKKLQDLAVLSDRMN